MNSDSKPWFSIDPTNGNVKLENKNSSTLGKTTAPKITKQSPNKIQTGPRKKSNPFSLKSSIMLHQN